VATPETNHGVAISSETGNQKGGRAICQKDFGGGKSWSLSLKQRGKEKKSLKKKVRPGVGWGEERVEKVGFKVTRFGNK